MPVILEDGAKLAGGDAKVGETDHARGHAATTAAFAFALASLVREHGEVSTEGL